MSDVDTSPVAKFDLSVFDVTRIAYAAQAWLDIAGNPDGDIQDGKGPLSITQAFLGRLVTAEVKGRYLPVTVDIDTAKAIAETLRRGTDLTVGAATTSARTTILNALTPNGEPSIFSDAAVAMVEQNIRPKPDVIRLAQAFTRVVNRLSPPNTYNVQSPSTIHEI
jgi:hypothetical protein